MRRTATAVAIAAASFGCGGDSGPTTPASPVPTPTPPPVFTVTDGVTGTPLTPGSVTPSDPRVGQSVTVNLEGYLLREQVWDGTPVALWPCRDDTEAEAFRQLVYGPDSRPLVKWATVDIDANLEVVGDDWAGDIPEIEDVVGRTFVDVAAAGGPTISWASVSGGLEVVGGTGITVIVDRWHECLQEQYVACSRWWRDGNTIARAELIFDSPEMALDRKLRMHALGFLIGLAEVDLRYAVMNPNWRPRGDHFHELERTALRMMYGHRNPGNTLPDRDPAFAPAAAGGGMEMRLHRGPGGR